MGHSKHPLRVGELVKWQSTKYGSKFHFSRPIVCSLLFCTHKYDTLPLHTFLQFIPGTHIKILLFWRELTGEEEINHRRSTIQAVAVIACRTSLFVGHKPTTRHLYAMVGRAVAVVLQERKKKNNNKRLHLSHRTRRALRTLFT